MFYRMACPRCRKRMEYTDLQVGHFAYCKKCNHEMVLRSNPVRVSLFLIITATAAFIAYGGFRMYRWTQHEGRFSTSNPVVMIESAPQHT